METDLLLNYETVKYFGGEQLETDRYVNATRKTQVASFRVTSTYHDQYEHNLGSSILI